MGLTVLKVQKYINVSSRLRKRCKNWGIFDYIEREHLLNYKYILLPYNRFTLCFEIEVCDQIKPKNYKNFDFKKIMNNKDLSDFKLIVDENEFFCP